MPRHSLLTLGLMFGLTAAVTTSAALAVPLQLVPTERTDTSGFIGLSIPFAPQPKLRISLGLRQTTVGSGGDLSGGELRLSFDPWTFGGVQVRALAMQGSVDHAGMVGGGWDFAARKPFGSLGVMLPHVSGTADIGLDGLVPQFALGLDSLGKVDAPALVFEVQPPPQAPCSGGGGPGPSVLGC